MGRFHLARDFVIPLPCGLSYNLAAPHELVPVGLVTLVDAHFSPRFDFFFPLPLGLPPSLPHARILRVNSFLPHCFLRFSALFFPMRLAALFTSFMVRTIT